MGSFKTLLASASALAFAACQPTIGDAPGLAGGGGRADAGDQGGGGGSQQPPDPDAGPVEPVPDAAPGQPQELTLTQTTSDQVLESHSIACFELDDNDDPLRNLQNSYYRVFDLEELGIDGDLEISSVIFGVESARSPDNSAQDAKVILHTLEGENLLVASLTEIANKDLSIDPATQTSLEVPIDATVPAGSTLVFELFIPAAEGDELFFIGSNALGETGPSYLRAPASGCDFIEPTEFADIGFPDVHIVMMVKGSYVPSSDSAGASEAELSRSETPARAAPRPVSVW